MSYVRISILGASPGGEVWSINPVYDPTGEFPGWNQANADAAVAAINALTIPTTLLQCLSTALTVTGTRLEVRDDGNDSLIGIAEGARATPQGGTGTPRLPAQGALVASLRTNTPGASGRGRLYWPAVGASIDTSLRLSSPTTTLFATDMKTYLNAIAGSLASSFPSISFNLAVRSRQTKTTPHVARIQVGNVFDTQRRRRDNIPEAYATVTM